MAVRNASNITLQEVVNEINPASNTLQACFEEFEQKTIKQLNN